MEPKDPKQRFTRLIAELLHAITTDYPEAYQTTQRAMINALWERAGIVKDEIVGDR